MTTGVTEALCVTAFIVGCWCGYVFSDVTTPAKELPAHNCEIRIGAVLYVCKDAAEAAKGE